MEENEKNPPKKQNGVDKTPSISVIKLNKLHILLHITETKHLRCIKGVWWDKYLQSEHYKDLELKTANIL